MFEHFTPSYDDSPPINSTANVSEAIQNLKDVLLSTEHHVHFRTFSKHVSSISNALKQCHTASPYPGQAKPDKNNEFDRPMISRKFNAKIIIVYDSDVKWNVSLQSSEINICSEINY